MKVDRPGYSGQIYKSAGLRQHAEFVLRTLDKLKDQFDFVVVRGKSGMAVAFAALAMGADFPLVTIRKGESSHGQHIEGIAEGTRYVVVDDLIDTGSTLHIIHDDLGTYAENMRQERPRMVAVLLHAMRPWENPTWDLDGQYEAVAVIGGQQ